MANVKPFKGLRANPDLVGKIAAPPYDVLDSDEARDVVHGNEYSFLHIGKPEVDLPKDVDLYDERVYQKARENFQSFIKKGWLVQDTKDCYYIYRQQMGEHVQIGIVAGASVDDYENDIIKKHELTRKDKEDDRTKHVYTTKSQSGPVFLTYRADAKIDTLVADYMHSHQPVYSFQTTDRIIVDHTFWVVDETEKIEALRSYFAVIPVLYVADGHHRSAAAMRTRALMKAENKNHTGNEEYNYFLSVIFPHNQMFIMDYNRIVKDLNGLSKDAFLKTIGEKYDIHEIGSTGKPYHPENVHDFGMYLDRKWYKISAKKGSFDEKDPIKSLDVSILQENLLSPVLGIGDPRTDKRINFVGGIRGLNELEKNVDSGKYAVAFAMHATTIEQLMAVADAGKIMPPKSTWFEPKLRDGLCTHMI